MPCFTLLYPYIFTHIDAIGRPFFLAVSKNFTTIKLPAYIPGNAYPEISSVMMLRKLFKKLRKRVKG